MYFAETSKTTNFQIYKGLLDKYLENRKHDETRLFFEQIIRTTHELIIGQIEENKIDHTIYSLVTSLTDYKNQNNRKYFEDINPNSIGLDQLRTLSGILSSLVASENEMV